MDVIVPEPILHRARVVLLNYPNNLAGAVAPSDDVERTIEPCRKYVRIAWDNPDVELTYDGYRAPSILEHD